MEIVMLKSKIHRAKVTQSELDYVGSVTIDADLLRAAGMREYEKVLIADINNGNRLETYTIEGESGSGVICLNGAAAKCIDVGDKVIIMSFAHLSPEEADSFAPVVVFVNEENKPVRIAKYEKHGKISEFIRA